MVDKRVDAAAAMNSIGIAAVDESELDCTVRETVGRQSKDCRGRARRQSAGDRCADRPGEELNPNVDPSRFREMCLHDTEIKFAERE